LPRFLVLLGLVFGLGAPASAQSPVNPAGSSHRGRDRAGRRVPTSLPKTPAGQFARDIAEVDPHDLVGSGVRAIPSRFIGKISSFNRPCSIPDGSDQRRKRVVRLRSVARIGRLRGEVRLFECSRRPLGPRLQFAATKQWRRMGPLRCRSGLRAHHRPMAGYFAARWCCVESGPKTSVQRLCDRITMAQTVHLTDAAPSCWPRASRPGDGLLYTSRRGLPQFQRPLIGCGVTQTPLGSKRQEMTSRALWSDGQTPWLFVLGRREHGIFRRWSVGARPCN